MCTVIPSCKTPGPYLNTEYQDHCDLRNSTEIPEPYLSKSISQSICANSTATCTDCGTVRDIRTAGEDLEETDSSLRARPAFPVAPALDFPKLPSHARARSRGVEGQSNLMLRAGRVHAAPAPLALRAATPALGLVPAKQAGRHRAGRDLVGLSSNSTI